MVKKRLTPRISWATMIMIIGAIIGIIFIAPKILPTNTPLSVITPNTTSQESDPWSGGVGGGSDSTPTYWINLEIIPDDICIGESATATATSNMPGASCTIYYKTNVVPAWFIYKSITLSKSGSYSETNILNTAGTATFYVTCRYNNQNIDSNQKTLTVRDCGGSGTYTCTDSDGGINPNTWGHCEDSYHQAGFQDTCELIPGTSTYAVREYYCGPDNTCTSELITCSALAGLTCRDGKCTTI